MAARRARGLNPVQLSLADKAFRLNWPLALLLCMVAAVGVLMLYSAGGGSMSWSKS